LRSLCLCGEILALGEFGFMSTQNCIFCKIVAKEIKSEIVFENDKFVVFKDIQPQAPIHLLLIPKEHISSVNDITETNEQVLNGIFSTVKEIAKKFDFDKKGYRMVINNGKEAGQAVDHLHLHILAGRSLKWPPG